MPAINLFKKTTEAVLQAGKLFLDNEELRYNKALAHGIEAINRNVSWEYALKLCPFLRRSDLRIELVERQSALDEFLV